MTVRVLPMLFCRFVAMAAVGVSCIVAVPKATDASDHGKVDFAGTHWSFQPIGRPAVPAFAAETGMRNGVDAFILQKLRAQHIRPSPEADRATLIRRVSLDLIGLPPTPDDVATFVNDVQPGAYQRLVDLFLGAGDHCQQESRQENEGVFH